MPTSLRAGGWGCPGGGARSVERPGGQLTRPVGPTPRVEESGCRLLESERRLQEERQRTALLEQHLEKMRLEPGGGAAQRAAARSRAGRAGPEARCGAGSLAACGGARRSPVEVDVGSGGLRQGGAPPAPAAACPLPRSLSEPGPRVPSPSSPASP